MWALWSMPWMTVQRAMVKEIRAELRKKAVDGTPMENVALKKEDEKEWLHGVWFSTRGDRKSVV